MPSKPNILVLPKPSLYRQLFAADVDARLRGLGHVDFHDGEADLTSRELARRIGSYDVVVTGWRVPAFTDEVLDRATRLKLVAHSAGSIKFMFDEAALDRGFAITTVASAMASPVAEMSLLLILMCLRGVHRLDARMKAGEEWFAVKSAGSGGELMGKRVGVIGAGYVGRRFVQLLRALEVDVIVYDPYLSDRQAGELGVTKLASLDELMSACPIVSLQAPATAETRRMIGRRELALLCDGAVFVNTARAWCVDEAALLDELRAGRIAAALDVFDDEPLPADSPFRALDNCIVTPHVAAATRECRYRQGKLTVDETERFVNGQPLMFPVTKQQYQMMA